MVEDAGIAGGSEEAVPLADPLRRTPRRGGAALAATPLLALGAWWLLPEGAADAEAAGWSPGAAATDPGRYLGAALLAVVAVAALAIAAAALRRTTGRSGAVAASAAWALALIALAATAVAAGAVAYLVLVHRPDFAPPETLLTAYPLEWPYLVAALIALVTLPVALAATGYVAVRPRNESRAPATASRSECWSC